MTKLYLLDDIRDKDKTTNDYKFLAYHDPLTYLPNRLYFDHYLQWSINQSKEMHRILAILYIDLDRFKQINDSLGHSYGDRVLKEATKRLTHCKRESDFLARIGGDEFVCVLPNIEKREDAERSAIDIIKELEIPYYLNDQECYLSASIGISFYPFDGDDVDMLVTYADSAMYRAKKKGRGNYQLASVEKNAGAYEILMLENELRKAVKQKDFLLYYQPKVDIKENIVVGFEALIRWNHKEFGMISPQQIIPLAEETGLIIPIGEWVFQEACTQNMEWSREHNQIFSIAINVSPQQFLEAKFVDNVMEVLKNTGMPANRLELEMTESILIHQTDVAIVKIKKLKEYGVKISIDDFGTGYSSLNYLRRLPVDTLKIDKSFIQDMETSVDSTAIIHAITKLAHHLNIHVIAEGVETSEQLEKLREPGCDQVQGYLFSKPMESVDVIQWLDSFK